MEFQPLAVTNPKALRTIADALEVLREQAAFRTGDLAQLRVGPLPSLPSRRAVWLVSVQFQAPSREKIYGVPLPSLPQCTAIREGASKKEKFQIFRLDGASVDSDANVVLADGVRLRAVEVIPERLPYEPSKLDWKIIRTVILINGAEERCVWRFRDRIPFEFRETVPDLRSIDCSTLVGLDQRPLKVITSLLRERDKTLEEVSDQKFSDALQKFGVRVACPRPRVQGVTK